jgi:two-component system, sensor histidine kinase LadS
MALASDSFSSICGAARTVFECTLNRLERMFWSGFGANSRSLHAVVCVFCTFCALCIFHGFGGSHTAFANDSSSLIPVEPVLVRVPEGSASVFLPPHMLIYEDSSAVRGIQEISSPLFVGFRRNVNAIERFEYSSSAFWLKIRITAGADGRCFIELPTPFLEQVDVYWRVLDDSSHSFSHQILGLSQKRNVDEIHHYPLCSLALPPHARVEVYVRVASTGPLEVPAYLRNSDEQYRQLLWDNFLWGGFYIMLAVLALYNFFLFASTRDRLYGLYSVFVTGMIFNVIFAFGHGYNWFLRGAPELSSSVLVLSMAYSTVTSLAFARYFLALRGWVTRLTIVFILCYCAVSVGVFIPPVSAFCVQAITASDFLSGILVGVMVITALRHGYRPARFFALAWAVYLLAYWMYSLKVLGILPNTFFTTYGAVFGSALEAILMAFALGDRIRLLRHEKQAAQNALLKQQEEANLHLETMVEERTKQLQDSVLMLSAANEEIERQLEVQAENTREIELANSSLHEKNIQLEELVVALNDANAQLAHTSKALNVTNNELSEANEFKIKMLSVAAHDLRNPLGAIMGMAELLQMRFAGNAEQAQDNAHLLRQITTASSRMLGLIHDLLETSALELGKIRLHRERADVSRIVQGVLESHERAAAVKQQFLKTEIESGCWAEIDSARMQQVFDNLISNAIKYSPLATTISVKLARTTDFVTFSVRDAGPGISDDDKSKLFRHFQQLSAKPTAGETSTGIGLAIVKQITDLHNARLWFENNSSLAAPALSSAVSATVPMAAQENTLAQGATFFVSIPIVAS